MAIKIIDISHHQPPSMIDYDQLASGADGFIVRAAYGARKDRYFEIHYTELKLRGKPLGVYQYLVNYTPVRDQMDMLLECVQGKKFRMGFWADVELENGAEPLTRARVDQYMTIAEAELGMFGIYSSKYYWDTIMRTSAYKNRKLWVANYGVTSPAMPATGGWTKWWMWQSTSSYRMAGYSGGLDFNHFWGSPEDFNNWVGIPVVDPAEPVAIAQVMMSGNLTIRTGPSTTHPATGQYALAGKLYDVFEISANNWYRIVGGWISGNTAYTRLIEAQPAEYTLEEKVEKLWVAHPELH